MRAYISTRYHQRHHQETFQIFAKLQNYAGRAFFLPKDLVYPAMSGLYPDMSVEKGVPIGTPFLLSVHMAASLGAAPLN